MDRLIELIHEVELSEKHHHHWLYPEYHSSISSIVYLANSVLFDETSDMDDDNVAVLEDCGILLKMHKTRLVYYLVTKKGRIVI